MNRRRTIGASSLPVALLALLALSGIVATAGCELKVAGEASGGGGMAPLCTSDSDCPAGDRCETEIGACVSAEANELRVAVQLTPPGDAAYAMTQYLDFSLEDGAPLDLTLPAPRRVRGWVRVDRYPLEANLAATVTARAAGDIPGTEYRSTATSQKNTQRDPDYGYELLLAPTSQFYQLSVDLENEDFPPYNLPLRKFGSEEEWLDLVVPALSDYHRISGRLLTDEATDTGLDKVRVAAFSEGTANVSTVSDVASDGSFELSVPPEPDGDSYRVVVEPLERTVALPRVALRAGLFVDADIDLGELALGDLPAAVAQPVRVTGPDGALAVDVAVRCAGAVLDGTLTDEAPTDEEGVATLFLRKGTYECTCFPPAGSAAAADRWTGRVVADGTAWEFTLGEKVRVEGVVTDHGQETLVPGVVVIAVHAGEDDPLHGTEVETTTDDAGHFVLQLERATYAFILRPPEGASLPVRVVEGVAIDAPTNLDFPLPAATLVSGTVRGAAGELLEGVRVDFYQLTDASDDEQPAAAAAAGSAPSRIDRTGTPTTSYERLVRVVGSAVTDADGVYHALLPNP